MNQCDHTTNMLNERNSQYIQRYLTLLGLGVQGMNRKFPLSFSLSIHFHFNIPSPSRVN